MPERPPRFSVSVKTISEDRVKIVYVREYKERVPEADTQHMQALVAQVNEATRARGSGDLMGLEVDGNVSTMTFYGTLDIILLFLFSELLELADDPLATYQAVNPHLKSITGTPGRG